MTSKENCFLLGNMKEIIRDCFRIDSKLGEVQMLSHALELLKL